MSTLGNLKARIADEMKRTELSACATAVQVAIVEAIQFFQRRKFEFNEFNGQVKTTVASTTAVTLSINGMGKIFSVDTAKAVIGSRDYPLDKRQWIELDRIDSGQYYGYPEYYAIQSNQIRFYPPPADAYNIRIAGTKALTEVSLNATANATNAWVDPDQAGNMIKLKAKSILFRDHLRSPNMADRMENDAMKEFRELSRETREKQSSGRLRPTRW
jgi:hypothetical protein